MNRKAIGTMLSVRRGGGRPHRIAAALVLVSLAGAAAPGSGAVSDDVKLLPFRRALLGLPAPAAGGAGIVFAEDSLLAAGAAPDLRDVRVVNRAGEAVPYRRVEPSFHDDVLVPVPGAAWSPVPDSLRAEGSGNWTGYLRLGERGTGIPVIGLPAETAPWSWTVEGSADGATWSGASLEPWQGDLNHFDRHSHTYWTLRPPTFRFLRVALPEPPPGGALPAPSLFRWERRPVPVAPASFRVASAGYAGRTWRAVLEADGGPRTLAWFRYAASGGADRGIHRLEVRDEEGTWRAVAMRPAQEGVDFEPAAETGTVRWTGPRATAVRITVEGGDPPNDPIRILDLGWIPTRFLVSAVEAPLWVAYGDAFVPPPLAAPEPRPVDAPEARTVAMGPPEPNPHYSPPGFGLRWLVRRPAILTATMAVTLALVLWVALRSRAGRVGAAG